MYLKILVLSICNFFLIKQLFLESNKSNQFFHLIVILTINLNNYMITSIIDSQPLQKSLIIHKRWKNIVFTFKDTAILACF